LPITEAVWLAFAQIRVQKLKSFFTLIGVTIGVMFLIAVVSIVEGMGNYMEHDFAAKLFGINTFELRRRPDFSQGNISDDTWREWQRRPRIRDTDIQPVVNALPPGTLWSAEGQDNVQMVSPYSKPRTLSASAVDGDYFKIRNLEVASGRLISPQELALGSPVIVIGKEIADKFFPNLDPVGRELRVGGLPFTVVGVAVAQGSVFQVSTLRSRSISFSCSARSRRISSTRRRTAGGPTSRMKSTTSRCASRTNWFGPSPGERVGGAVRRAARDRRSASRISASVKALGMAGHPTAPPTIRSSPAPHPRL